MAWLSRTERAVRDGDLHVVAQEIVADLKKALEVATTADERIRLAKELGEWLPKTVAPRAPAETRPLPGPESAEARGTIADIGAGTVAARPLVAWDGE